MQNLIKISTGKILNAVFAFVVSVIIARKLGASDFGLFTLSLSVAMITQELIGSECIDNGMVRFASLYLNVDTKRANLLFKVAIKIKLLMVSIAFLISIIIFKTSLVPVISKPELKSALIIGIFTGCFSSFWRYVLAFLQCFERFSVYAFINTIPNFSKVLLILLLVLTGSLNLTNALFVNVATLILGFIIGFLFIPKDFILVKGNERDIAFKLFHFSKWLFIANLLFALCSRLDVLMLSYYTKAEFVGDYSVALSFIIVLDLMYVSMITKFFPQVCKLTSKSEFIIHIKKSLLMSLGLAIVISIMFFIAKPLILSVYSENYFDSILYFKILLAGFLFTLTFNPLSLILFARNKPYIITFVCLIMLIVNFCGNLLLIPKYGAIGTAYVVTVTRVTGGLMVLFFTLKEVFKLTTKESVI